MFFEDDHVAFANLKSWLKPGGRYAFAMWADLADNPWMGVVRDVVKASIDMPKAEPGPFRYADAACCVSRLKHAGFCDVSATVWDGSLKRGGGRPAPDAAEFGLSAFWQEFTASSSDHKRALELLTAALHEHEAVDGVSMQARVPIVTGRV